MLIADDYIFDIIFDNWKKLIIWNYWTVASNMSIFLVKYCMVYYYPWDLPPSPQYTSLPQYNKITKLVQDKSDIKSGRTWDAWCGVYFLQNKHDYTTIQQQHFDNTDVFRDFGLQMSQL